MDAPTADPEALFVPLSQMFPITPRLTAPTQGEPSLSDKIYSFAQDNIGLETDLIVRKLPNETYPMISFNGGGSRGYIHALVLNEIQRRTGLEPAEGFKYFAGTSIGGIVAGLLNKESEKEPGKPANKVVDLINLFEKEAVNIFPCYSSLNLYRWVYPEYARDGLHQILDKYVGKAFLSQGLREIMIPTLCENFEAPWLFTKNDILFRHNNNDKKGLFHNPKKEDFKNILAIDILEATSAAPTFFDAKEISIGTNPYTFWDGGIFCNNPAMSAFSHAYHINGPNTNYLMCSIGTGIPPPTKGSIGYLRYLYWAKKFPELAIRATARNDDITLREFLPEEGEDPKLFIFEPDISEIDNTVDGTSPEHFERLADATKKMLEEKEESLRELCKKLNPEM